MTEAEMKAIATSVLVRTGGTLRGDPTRTDGGWTIAFDHPWAKPLFLEVTVPDQLLDSPAVRAQLEATLGQLIGQAIASCL